MSNSSKSNGPHRFIGGGAGASPPVDAPAEEARAERVPAPVSAVAGHFPHLPDYPPGPRSVGGAR